MQYSIILLRSSFKLNFSRYAYISSINFIGASTLAFVCGLPASQGIPSSSKVLQDSPKE